MTWNKFVRWWCDKDAGEERLRLVLADFRLWTWHDLKDKSVYCNTQGSVVSDIENHDGVYTVFALYGNYQTRCEFGKYVDLSLAKKRAEDLQLNHLKAIYYV